MNKKYEITSLTIKGKKEIVDVNKISSYLYSNKLVDSKFLADNFQEWAKTAKIGEIRANCNFILRVI